MKTRPVRETEVQNYLFVRQLLDELSELVRPLLCLIIYNILIRHYVKILM